MLEEHTGFVDGHVEPIIEDDPAKHTVPALCCHCGKPGDLICPHCQSTNVTPQCEHPADGARAAFEKIRRVLLYCHDHKKPRYAFGCFLIAIGDPAAGGVTMTEFAKQWRVTRAAVSKECCSICAWLGIKPSPYMKSEESKKSFRRSNYRPIKRTK